MYLLLSSLSYLSPSIPLCRDITSATVIVWSRGVLFTLLCQFTVTALHNLFSYREKQFHSHFRRVFNTERVWCWYIKVISFGHDTGLCLRRISWIDDELDAARLNKKTDSIRMTCLQNAANRNFFFATWSYFLFWFIMPYEVCIGIENGASEYQTLLFDLASTVRYEKCRLRQLLLHVVVVHSYVGNGEVSYTSLKLHMWKRCHAIEVTLFSICWRFDTH